MTNSEAIRIINQYDCNFYWTDGEKIPTKDLIEAFELAINALKAQEPHVPGIRHGIVIWEDALTARSDEPWMG